MFGLKLLFLFVVVIRKISCDDDDIHFEEPPYRSPPGHFAPYQHVTNNPYEGPYPTTPAYGNSQYFPSRPKGSSAHNSSAPLPIGHCYLPPHLSHGAWFLLNPPSNYSVSATIVPNHSILQIGCNPSGYTLDGCGLVACVFGNWFPPIGTCAKTCPSIQSTETVTVKCVFKDQETKDCLKPRDGTLAYFKCKSFYEDNRLSKSKAICIDGQWSEDVPKCIPICGRASLRKKPTLIVNGSKTKKGEFPWQIALYTKREKILICGGALLSERVVLTAAHCITTDEGNIYPKEQYIVVAGKYYRKLDHPEDAEYSQIAEIHEMYVSDEYGGEELDFAGDIAVIIVRKSFKFTTRVQPVCIDWLRAYEHQVIDSDDEKGYVSGWGHTRENSEPANELRSLRIPSLSRKECRKILPEEYRRYMTFDKFCAGYRNNGTSVCGGDSGGGLVFKREGRFYIAGVVSLAPLADAQEGGCDSQQYSLYTLVYNYTDNFILKNLAEFKLISGGNVAAGGTTTTTPQNLFTERPQPPNTCKFPLRTLQYAILQKKANYSSNMRQYVPVGTTIRVNCSGNYKYNGTDVIECRKEGWSTFFGNCLELCPPLHNSDKVKVFCTYKGEILGNCTQPIDNTVAKFECAPFYEFSTLETKPSVCRRGEWSKMPECVPVCGQASKNLQEDYPWQAAIYKQSDKQLVCEGSLINTKIIITAAHCLTDNKGNLLPQDTYVVAVGKQHNQYNHPEDVDAQYSKIQKILIPKTYKAENYQGDIAMIITEKSFVLSSLVQPVCIDWETSKAVGWGFSKSLESSVQQNFTLVSGKECADAMEEEFGEYLTHDKFCAVSTSKDISQCQSTSSGLVIKEDNKHYLVGVATSIPGLSENESCASLPYTLFIKINSYTDRFILEAERQHRS